MPVLGLWLEDGFYFSTARSSRKSRNLRDNPLCVVSSEAALEAVILEGRAEPVFEKPLRTRIEKLYRAKYDEAIPDESDVFVVRPLVGFGFIDREEEFTGASTRWRFSP